MIDPAYVKRMARYNRWQNQNLFGVADRLSDEERRRERGAFFGSARNHADGLYLLRLQIADADVVRARQAAAHQDAAAGRAHVGVIRGAG